jgi:ADP-ribose pyrophosphatase
MASQELPEIRPWRILDQQLLLSAPPWLSVYREQVELPSGRIIEDFYRVVLPDFATVVPITATGEILLVRGYKHGLGRVALSVPAGLMHPGEPALDAAQRELLEETGYEATDWQELGTFIVDGNRQCGTMHAFLARNARPTRPPQEDETEELQVELLTRQQLVEGLRNGEIATLAGAAAVTLGLVLGLSSGSDASFTSRAPGSSITY